jgi:hypothetical protein
MSLDRILKECRVTGSDARTVKRLVAEGKTPEQAIKAALLDSFSELEELRGELKAAGFPVDVQPIEIRKDDAHGSK